MSSSAKWNLRPRVLSPKRLLNCQQGDANVTWLVLFQLALVLVAFVFVEFIII
jgi:hypothetical protein